MAWTTQKDAQTCAAETRLAKWRGGIVAAASLVVFYTLLAAVAILAQGVAAHEADIFIFDGEYLVRSASACVRQVFPAGLPTGLRLALGLLLPASVLATLTLFAPPPKRTPKDKAALPDVPKWIRLAVLVALSTTLAFAALLLVSPPQALSIGHLRFMPFVMLGFFTFCIAPLPCRFAKLRIAVALPLLLALLATAVILAKARLSTRGGTPGQISTLAAGDRYDARRLAALSSILSRNGLSKIAIASVTGTSGSETLAKRLEAVSNGAVKSVDYVSSPYGKRFVLDGFTVLLVSGREADATAAEFSRAGLSMRRIAGLEPDVLFTPNASQPGASLAAAKANGCLFIRDGKVIAAPADDWMRTVLSLSAPLSPEKDGWLIDFAPTSTMLLRAILPAASENTALEILENLRLFTEPDLGSEVSFGNNLRWKGARILSGEHEAAPGGTVKICHYWKLAGASASMGRFRAEVALASPDGKRLKDTFVLDHGTANITSDDAGEDTADFITIRDVQIPADAAAGIWSLEIGVTDSQRYGYPLSASSVEQNILQRKAIIDGGLIISDTKQE